MTDEKAADEEPVQVEEAVEEEADVVEAEAETHVEPEPEADAPAEEATVDPEVQEFIGQDTTVLHKEPEGDGVIPTDFRTPPGIPSGLDPGTPSERAAD